MTRIRISLLLLLLLAIAVPFATADTIQLNVNNLGIGGSIGTVTLTAQGGGGMVTLQANAGYSFKLSGGGILFNTNASLTARNISSVLIDGKYTSNFTFPAPGPKPFRSFPFDIPN